MTVFRIDQGLINKPKMTDQGYLKADAFLTRVGVFTYKTMDGQIVRELKHPDDVFDPASLETLAGLPVTDEHPDEFLTAANTSRHQRGYTGDKVERIDTKLKSRLTITDNSLIERVVSKDQSEVSCGYHCDVVMEGGVYNGERYDARQKNIRYNHVAVVKRGRAGPEVNIRLDSSAAIMNSKISDDNPVVESQDSAKTKTDGGKMAKITIEGVEYEVSEAIASVVSANLKQKDSLATELANTKKDLETTKGRLDASASEVEKAKAASVSREDAMRDARARIDLEDFAGKILQGKKFDGSASDMDIKKAVIGKVYPSAKLDGRSDDYVNGQFEMIRENYKPESSGSRNLADIMREKASQRGDSEDLSGTYEKAREKAMKRDSEAWKTSLKAPIPNHKVA